VIYHHEKCTKAEAVVKSLRILDTVGIHSERSMDYPHSFSGGMKQRVVIAMALACNPKLLIADEPTTALDVTIQAQILEMMNKLKEELDTSMLLITHDLGIVAESCDNVAIMYAGQIVESGTALHIFNNASHPYTIGLFGSLPSLVKHVKRLSPIPGLMPDPGNLPEGCNFYDRCTRLCDRCKESEPELIEIEPGHLVRCVHFAGEEAKTDGRDDKSKQPQEVF
jgi:peptide/nickel transport system ATP-binding protein